MDWQHEVADFARANGLLRDPVVHVLDLTSEVGEVAKELLRVSDYGRRPVHPTPELADELGDALYSLLALAATCEIDAGRALEAALAKYERRITQRGSVGSR